MPIAWRVAIIALIGIIVGLIGIGTDRYFEHLEIQAQIKVQATQTAEARLTLAPSASVAGISTPTFTPTQSPTPTDTATATSTFTPAPTPTDTPTPDPRRDTAAQTLGYNDLDAFMAAYGISAEVKSRIVVCPGEESWCLSVVETPGVDFYFHNSNNCLLDGKLPDGTSYIPAWYEGPVRGFTVRAACHNCDTAAQNLGYNDLDAFMAAYEIPAEVKCRVFACPEEESYCLSVVESPGVVFHFRNITHCELDGKLADGTSSIPPEFNGQVKGFVVRPCP